MDHKQCDKASSLHCQSLRSNFSTVRCSFHRHCRECLNPLYSQYSVRKRYWDPRCNGTPVCWEMNCRLHEVRLHAEHHENFPCSPIGSVNACLLHFRASPFSPNRIRDQLAQESSQRLSSPCVHCTYPGIVSVISGVMVLSEPQTNVLSGVATVPLVTHQF